MTGHRATPPAPEDAIRELRYSPEFETLARVCAERDAGGLPECQQALDRILGLADSLVAAKEAAEEQAGDASALAVRLQDEAEDLREQRDALAEALRESNEAIDRFVATTSYFRQPKASRPEFEALLVARDTARAVLAALIGKETSAGPGSLSAEDTTEEEQ